MDWSDKQKDIFNFVETQKGNAIITAVAGSGKTTTIVEAIKRVTGNTIFLAFNKSIAEELKSRGVNAKTFHSLAFGAVLRHKNAKTVTQGKTFQILKENFKPDDCFLYGSFVTRLVSLGKQVGIGCLKRNTISNWHNIVSHHGLTLDNEKADIDRAVDIACNLLDMCNQSNLIDFDDMLYIPVLDGLSLPKFDFVFVDEAQDTNAIQRALLRKIMKPKTRMIAVGDPAQAIYGFRGADSSSMNLIASEFDCTEFPLSTSYRCGKNIVKHAQQWVSHIEAFEGAEDGEVIDKDTDWEITDFKKDDYVICRTTRPLISLAFAMLRNGIPVTILGREIGTGLVKLIKRFKTNELEDLEAKLSMWSNTEIERAIAVRNDSLASAIDDKTECLRCMLETVAEEGGDVNSLIDYIERMFSGKGKVTTLATIHKAKGLEGDRIYWLNSSECPSVWAKKPWQRKQEANLCYVATTRAKSELILIEME